MTIAALCSSRIGRKRNFLGSHPGTSAVFLNKGLPFSYYVDSHSIFRFVQGRDSFWRRHYKVTDEATPQWKQVLDDCKVKLTYALSPQSRGKVERPYRNLLG